MTVEKKEESRMDPDKVRQRDEDAEGLNVPQTGPEELYRVEDLYHSLFKNNHAVMLLIDPDTADIVDANPAACSFYCYSLEELTHKKITEINTLPVEQIFREMERAKAEKKLHTCFRHRLGCGDVRDVEVYSGPVKVDGKELLYSIVHDVTQRKRLEENLAESEERYRSLVEFAPVAIVVHRGGRFDYINPAGARLLGARSPDDLIGKPIMDFIHPDYSVTVRERIRKTVEERRETPPLVVKLLCLDSRVIDVEVAGKPIVYNGMPATQAVIRDITGQRQAQEHLRMAKDELEVRFAQRTRDLVRVNEELQNEIAERLRAEEVLRKKTYDLNNRIKEVDCLYSVHDVIAQHDLSLDEILRWVIRVVPRGWQHSAIACARIVLPGREYKTDNFRETIWNLSAAIVVHGQSRGRIDVCYLEERPACDEGPFLGEERDLINGIARHIGEMVEYRLADDLAKAEHAFRKAIEDSVPSGIAGVDQEGRQTYVNPAFCRMVGWTEEELVGAKPPFVYWPPEETENIYEVFQDILNGKTLTGRVELHLRRKNEERFHASVLFSQLKDGEGNVIGWLASISDITERKAAEGALKESESRLSEAQRIAHLGNWEWDMVNNKMHWSDECYRIFGLSPRHYIVDYDTFLSFVHPDDRKYLKKALNEALFREKPYSLDHRIVLPDGSLRVVHEEGEVVRDPTGKPMRVAGTVQDITKIKQAEEELISYREQLQNLAAHLETVREEERTHIAREIHDELGQVLTGLKMDLTWISERLPKDQEILMRKMVSNLSFIDSTIRTVKRICTELRPAILDHLGLGAAVEWQVEEFQLRTGIDYTLTVIPEDIVLSGELSTTLFRIFQEALTNVARHAEATKVVASLTLEEERIVLEVNDNGKGFRGEQLSRTRSFGLVGMRERVYSFGGDFSISSLPGEGTTVRVSIPLKVTC